MNLKDLYEQCLHILRQRFPSLSAPYPTLTTTNRVGFLGCYTRSKNLISLNKQFVELNYLWEKSGVCHKQIVMDTILHELCHFVQFTMDAHSKHHGALFQSVARTMGVRPTATTPGKMLERLKYRIRCPKCGASWYRHRLSKRMQRGHCGDCKEKLVVTEGSFVVEFDGELGTAKEWE